ncbi:conserved hypothetical protein [Altererythrobacter sp. B11]|uniref:YadA-like family protein n=1 Tax=Altererythrobacter sp. B11 TaxID=2060312 RepID=UPI000DC7192D|nr:YadA-like family protein [Altererythrobacter sp. B11]BBC72535.1 conserved hypothetical protein [Altererythrobacter sp. B11]
MTADGFQLDAEGGLAIGGNQITGLGADGAAPSAADVNSIALGNNATVTGTAPASVAIGTDASVTAANSVALGTGSTAARGAQTGYAAPGLAGTYSSAGEVSFGAPGAERQLTNIAPGTAATDAATVGQVQGALDAVDALADAAVQYDDATQATATLGGAGGTRLTNVAPGALNTTSTDAVNGAQLFDVNQRVIANSSAIAAIDPVAGNAVAYDDASLASVTLGGTTGTTISNVADGTLADTSTEAVNGSQLYATNVRVTANEADIDVLQQQVANSPVGYVTDADATVPSAVPTNTVAMRGAVAAPVRLTNVAPGTLAADSTDAVNGGQLYATNQAVAANRADIDQNTADIDTINNNLAGSTVVAVQYSDPANPNVSNGGTITNDVALVGADGGAPVALHNVANGTLATDAVNLGQMQSGLDAAMATSMDYTDQRIAQVGFDLADLRRDAYSGTASALAMAGIPQTLDPERAMVGGAIGHYRGQTAFALGASTAFSEGRVVAKAGATMDTHGNGGFTAGAGFSF